jgi:hypothetical protein
MRTFLPWALAAVLVMASRARAQEEPPPQPRPERLYVSSGVLQGSTRMVGIGGAYAGVGEGTASFSSNLAALAHRSPTLERDWDLGFTLSWLDLPLSSRRGQDLDNDGLPDEAPGSKQTLFGLLLQYKYLGLGTYLRSRTVSYCATAQCLAGDHIEVSVVQSSLAGAVALGQDEFIVSLGIYSAQATLTHQGEEWNYGGTGVSADLLFRPQGRPYRVGIAIRPQVVGAWAPSREDQSPILAGQAIYSAVVAPATLSLGVSYRFGEGAENYNRLSPAARRQFLADGEANVPPAVSPEAPVGTFLVSGQVDFISSVENAVALRSVATFSEPESVGSTVLLQPHIGAEHDTWPGRVRTRLGIFVEPSSFKDTLPRPHLTGGFEVFLFRYWEDWAFSASFDIARRYANVGLSLGFWR